MRKSHFYYIVPFVALVFALLGSCQKEDGASLLEEQKHYNFTLAEAKEYFYSKATDLQLPSQTVGKVKSGLLDLNDITTIDWANADIKDYVNYLSYEVPLHNSRYTHAVMLHKLVADSVLREHADVHFYLLLQKAKTKDTTRMLVSTIISLAKDRKQLEKLQSYKFHGNRYGFTGYMIVSTLEGKITGIYSYTNGTRQHYNRYTLNTSVDEMSENAVGFSFAVPTGAEEGVYGYSEYGVCRSCGKPNLLYMPDWYCMTCATHEIPGPVITPGDGDGGDSHVCDKCGVNPCVCCQCGGGCSCSCLNGCINCGEGDNPFSCPYCGQINCTGDCQHGGGGENPDPPGDGGGSSASDFWKIFYNDSLSTQEKERLEKIRDTLLNDCMGNMLYNSIKGYTANNPLYFNVSSGENGAFGPLGPNGAMGISIGKQTEVNQVIHELVHALIFFEMKASNPNNYVELYNSATLNYEIPANYAQYIFLTKNNYLKDGSKWNSQYNDDPRKLRIRKLSAFLDLKGNLLPNVGEEELELEIMNGIVPVFQKYHYTEENNYFFDWNNVGLGLFSIINRLTANCN